MKQVLSILLLALVMSACKSGGEKVLNSQSVATSDNLTAEQAQWLAWKQKKALEEARKMLSVPGAQNGLTKELLVESLPSSSTQTGSSTQATDIPVVTATQPVVAASQIDPYKLPTGTTEAPRVIVQPATVPEQTAPAPQTTAATEPAATPIGESEVHTSNAAETDSVAQTTAQKKKWSTAAKGAVIGAGAGAATGAVIAKDNRVLGAVIGAIAGSGAGFGLGKIIDKKKEE